MLYQFPFNITKHTAIALLRHLYYSPPLNQERTYSTKHIHTAPNVCYLRYAHTRNHSCITKTNVWGAFLLDSKQRNDARSTYNLPILTKHAPSPHAIFFRSAKTFRSAGFPVLPIHLYCFRCNYITLYINKRRAINNQPKRIRLPCKTSINASIANVAVSKTPPPLFLFRSRSPILT